MRVVYFTVSIPFLVGIAGYLFSKEKRYINALSSFGMGLLVISLMLFVFYVYSDIRNEKDIKDLDQQQQIWNDEVKEREQARNDLIQREVYEKEKNLKEVISLSQNEIINKKLGSEFLTTGVVVDHNLEDVNILGGYIQIKLNVNGKNAFVIYNPYISGKQSDCSNRLQVDLEVGDIVEVRGVVITEINSVVPQEILISTCESNQYYIKKI